MDGDLRGRDIVAAILQSGTYPIATLANGCVRQAHRVEVVLIALDARAVDLHLDDIGVDAIDCRAKGLVEHGTGADYSNPSTPPSQSRGILALHSAETLPVYKERWL